LYPKDTFVAVAKKVADWIDVGVTVNQEGFVVYVGQIRSRSFQVDVVPPIEVPAIPNDDPEPTPRPDYTPQAGENGYHATDMQSTITATNEQAHANWQKQVNQNYQMVQDNKTRIKAKTDAIRALDPEVDVGHEGADVYGCLADASQHFQNTPVPNEQTAEYDLIMASSFINNTSVNISPNINLHGAHVYGIYRSCTEFSSVSSCLNDDASWKRILVNLGANQDITFYDPLQSQSLSPLF
jgi:hypothetical protein